MLSPEFIKNNLDLVEESCRQRGEDFDVKGFLADDEKRRSAIQKVDELREKRNKLSGDRKPSPEILKAGQDLKKEIKAAEANLASAEKKVFERIGQLPNVLLPEVPRGKGEEDNVILREWGQTPNFDFPAKSYLEIGEGLDLIDVSRAAKMAGSRFNYLKGELVLMQFALLDLVLEITRPYGFQPIIPPVMIKPELMEKLGYTSLAESNIYLIEKDGLNLVGTSEQSLGAMHQGEILSDLPRRYLGYSTCFRREAGTYGQDLKGILRVHQFDKAEMFSFCRSDQSKAEHDLFVEIEEQIMQALELPYRVVALSAGELAKPSTATVDIEAWLPSEGKYRETHSSSNCTDFQARGLNIRYRAGGKTDFAHTVNGTALAMSRILAVILENYQQAEGGVRVPSVLEKRLGFKEISR